MDIQSRILDNDENVIILQVKGRITAGSLSALEQQIESHTKGKAAKLILDLQNVDSVDSLGVGLLIKARYDVVNSGGKIVLLGPTERVRAVLRISGLEDYFLIAPTEVKALELLQ